jgi:hypothetical protein
MNLTIFQHHFSWSPTDGQFAESVDKPLLLDHGQVALATRAAVVVSHGPAHLLVVHFFAAVRLHPAPRSGKFHRVTDLKDAVSFADPADDPWVVGPVVQQVPDEDVEWRKRNFGCMLSGATPFTLDSTFSSKLGQSS